METLYDILGMPEDASDDELRRAYHRAARCLHPDVNPDVDTNEPMRRLNRAWAVLGDPRTRRSYDRKLHEPAPVRAPAALVYDDGPPLARLLRPSALIVAVLLVIFVVTAYAGPGSNDRRAAPSSVTSTAPTAVPDVVAARGLLGECLKILPGYDAVVQCDPSSDGEVVAEVQASSGCPAATRPYQLAGRTQIVCLARAGTVP